MHDLKWIESHSEDAKKLLAKRGQDVGLDAIIKLVKERRQLILDTEELKAKRNAVNDSLKASSKTEIDVVREEMRALSQRIKEGDHKLQGLEEDLEKRAMMLPNIPLPSVPEGKSEADNVEVARILAIPHFTFPARDHVELGQLTDTIDFARAAKISGARFAFLKGDAAKLNRALLQFLTNYHVERGDIELAPPYLVRESAMVGSGQFPKFVDDAFKVTKEGSEEPHFLIPTAEVPVTNFYADEIIDAAELPIRFCSYSPCFRAEAGAAGRDTRGLIRQHQFEKVEMVRFVRPEDAMRELDMMVERASSMLSALGLCHRIVELCGGDLGFHPEKTFDIEVYLPGQETFREISSCSSFGTFQARRAKIRMRKEGQKPEPLVTLNGSGLPLGRTLVAIYENFQRADGSIAIPKVLQPYMGGQEVIKVR